MLQGLLIRKTFLLFEWALVVLILCGASFAAYRLFGQRPDDQDALPSVSESETAPTQAAAAGTLAARESYDVIVSSGLLGSAGQAAAAVVQPLPTEAPTDTGLPLQLRGTAASSPKDPLATAIILNEETKEERVYFVDQEVVPQVVLEEVHPRLVVLLNKVENRRETLRVEEDKQQVLASSTGKPAVPKPDIPAASTELVVNKTELISDVAANYNNLINLKPRLYKDETGKVAGITADDIESVPLAQKLNLKNGDVLQSINNEMIDSQGKVMSLMEKFQDEPAISVGILRDGQRQTITYRVQ